MRSPIFNGLRNGALTLALLIMTSVPLVQGATALQKSHHCGCTDKICCCYHHKPGMRPCSSTGAEATPFTVTHTDFILESITHIPDHLPQTPGTLLPSPTNLKIPYFPDIPTPPPRG